jgi:phosphatidate phosphatase PAH1
MVIVDELHALRVHERRPANLRHGGQQKVSSFFMQLTVEDLRALRMPPGMDQVLTERFKVKKGGQPVNTFIYLGKWC